MYIREVPFAQKKLLIFFAFIAVCSGIAFDYWSDTRVDNWLHDSALVFQARKVRQYSAVVVLDDGVPIRVGRKQALPLFAKAAERLIAAGAKGVFLDSRVSKEIEGRMPYALCIEENGDVQWSEPNCSMGSSQQCYVNNSAAGNAPLAMNVETIALFSIAPYLGEVNLPDFLLYDLEAASAIPETGLVASDRLVTNNDPIARWFDLSRDHAVIKLANYISPELTEDSYRNNAKDEICNGDRLCRRIRLSFPILKTQTQGGQLVLPVSQLASCQAEIAEQTAALVKDRVVILQTTMPSEATDIIVTPMTTALFGPKALTPGAQFLADAVETLLNQDHPRQPEVSTRIILFVLVAITSVLVGAYLKQTLLWCSAAVVFISVAALCLFNPLVQLWPVSATMVTFFTGAGQTIGAHLLLGFKEGELISHYMPRQIHNLLISLRNDEPFQNRRCYAIVLMSDLAGYTTVTSLLKEPSLVLNLMNDYLSETSIVLQDKYNGWLESYVGDMVCYYWPYRGVEQHSTY